MKHFLLLFTCLFTLTSCFSSENTEQSDNHSGTIISENTTQTGGKITEDQESHPISTHYTVSVEKSYFYTHPDDTEPRKAYVMRGDILEVNHEKSTKNMIFAVYANSEGKTTEGYLKKSDITAIQSDSLKQEEIANVSNCKRIYTFSEGHDEVITGHRQFEFHFVGDCSEQKSPLNIGIYNLSDVKIGLATGQKGYFMNWMHTTDTGWGFLCEIRKPNFSQSFNTGVFHISIKAGKEMCTTGDGEYEERQNYNINIEVSEKGKGRIFEIFFNDIPKSVLEQNYKDLLWTMENGFFEKSKQTSQGETNESRSDKIKIHQVDLTKGKIEKWEFTENLNALFFESNLYIPTGIDKVVHNYNEIIPCNEDRGRKIRNCKVTKIDGKFIFWEHSYGEFFDETLENGEGYYQENEHKEYYKTNIITEKTELLNETTSKNCMMEGGKKVMCRK